MPKPVLYFYTNMPTPYQLDFIDALKKIFELTVVYFTARESDRQWSLSLTGEGYRVVLLKNNWLARSVHRVVPSFHFSNEISSLSKLAPADLVIVNGTYWSPNVQIALRNSFRAGISTCFWGEPVFESKFALQKRFKRMMLRRIRNYTNFLLAIGRQAESSYRSFGYDKPIYNIPYNINNRLFQLTGNERQMAKTLRSSYGGPETLLLLTSGSLIHRKGIDTVIAAFQAAQEARPAQELKLVIIGDGPEKLSLKAMAGDNPAIYFLGFQQKEKIPEWFNMADIFIFASRYDGWALVINEAMAASLPIISSRSVGAAIDSLRDGENALLCDAGETEQFTTAILKLIDNPDLRKRLAFASGATSGHLSSDHFAQQLYEIHTVGK